MKGGILMNERIRFLREKLGLSRSAFGKMLGVSGDVINNLERGRVEIKEPIIKLICSEFSINETWLKSGIGEMELKTPISVMEQLKLDFNLDDFSYKLVYQYLKLNPEQRQIVRDFFYNVIDFENSTHLKTHKSYAEMTIDEKVDDYRKQLELEKTATEKSSVSQKDA